MTETLTRPNPAEQGTLDDMSTALLTRPEVPPPTSADPDAPPTARPRRRRRWLAGAGVLALVVGGVAVTVAAQEAPQLEYPVIKIKPGDELTVTGGPLVSDPSGFAISPPASDPRIDNCVVPICNGYRLEVELDETPGALNFVEVIVNWEAQAVTPPLGLVAVSLEDINIPDVDFVIDPEGYDYSAEDAYDNRNNFGASAERPERSGLTITDETRVYYILVYSSFGFVPEYEISLRMSNELFGSPNELLPPEAGRPPELRPAPIAGPTTGSGGFDLDGSGKAPTKLNPIARLPIGTDDDYLGFGLAISENVADNPLADLSAAEETAAVDLPDPTGERILLWVLLVPLAVAAVGGSWLYRRRPKALAATIRS